MIYLVSKQKSLFESDLYQPLDKKEALDMIMAVQEIEFDSETEGLDPHTKKLLCTQYGLGEHQIVVDNTSIDINYFKPVFSDAEKILLGWNLSFDIKFLYKFGLTVENVWDGMIAEKLLHLGYPAQFHSMSLQSAAYHYLGLNLDKTVRGKIVNVGLTSEVIEYAAHDVVYLKAIKEKQLVELEKKDLLKAVEFENKFVPVISYMEFCGAKLDVDKWKVKMASDLNTLNQAKLDLDHWVENYYNENKGQSEYTITVKKHVPDMKSENKILDKIPPKATDIRRRFIDNEVYYTYSIPFHSVKINLQGDLFSGFDDSAKCCINWGSSAQVVPLFELLGLNCTVIDKKTKEKKKSADIKLIEPQKEKSPIVDLYVKYKKAKILVDTFGQKFINHINPVTGRIHPSYWQLGADTGRLSASEPSLMNLPKDKLTRSCFVADKGNKWISIDYSGQESFLMASIANDKAMLDELVNGSGDLHSLTAKMVFLDIPRDTSLKDVKNKFHDYRQEAKGYEFCFNYGGSASTLVKNYGIPSSRAREIEDNYMSGFSGLKNYQDRQRQYVLDHGYILLNPITKHKAFIYDWEDLCKIDDELDTIDGKYGMYREDAYMSGRADFLRRRISDSQKQSINYPIQHQGSMCFKLSAIMFFNYLKKNNLLFIVKYCVPVHDEHNVEAPEEMADSIAETLKLCMEKAGEPFCTRAKLTADISVGDYWIH